VSRTELAIPASDAYAYRQIIHPEARIVIVQLGRSYPYSDVNDVGTGRAGDVRTQLEGHFLEKKQ
jgi:hypothetical protein